MTYYIEGMPVEVRNANAEYDRLFRATRGRPSGLTAHLGVVLKYAADWFTAQKNATEANLEFIRHLGRCDTCRGLGWEKCEEMTARLTGGQITHSVALF